jgi:hypothetical protein
MFGNRGISKGLGRGDEARRTLSACRPEDGNPRFSHETETIVRLARHFESNPCGAAFFGCDVSRCSYQ